MTSVERIAQFIIEQLTPSRPFFVAIQGPQGSGKSYTTAELRKFLQAPPHSLRVVSFSIDDLYLPHEQLVSLAKSNPDNVLWQGRGQPGTHDIGLGVQTLSEIKGGTCSIELPRFDKSLYSGEGDRLPLDGTGTIVKQPPVVDVVIFEGWCVGFRSVSGDELSSKWNGIWKQERGILALKSEQTGRFEDIEAINEKLRDYDRLWDFFDCIIKLKSEPPTSEMQSKYAIVYKWRLQQEHYMKATNGGRGMTDEEVKLFVDRYIPGYILFGDDETQTNRKRSKMEKKGLTLFLDENRAVVRSLTISH